MSSKKVQTVLGAIEPSDLGVTFCHEHLSMDYQEAAFTPPTPRDPERENSGFSLANLGWIRQYPYSHVDNLQMYAAQKDVLAEMKALKAAGGGTVVENTTIGIQRDLHFLRQVQKETGMKVVLGTGYYVDKVHPGDMKAKTEEGLADFMRSEIEDGCEGTDLKCGAMGELGCSWPLTDNEKKVLRAAAIVQSGNDAPAIIHPGRDSQAPFEIMRIFTEAGGRGERTIMSHLDRTLHSDEDILEFAKLDCFCEYDLFGIEVSHYQMAPVDMPSDAERIRRIKLLIDDGRLNQVTISHDIHTKHRLKAYGGHGYTHILENVVPMMKSRGISQREIDIILRENPRAWLSF